MPLKPQRQPFFARLSGCAVRSYSLPFVEKNGIKNVVRDDRRPALRARHPPDRARFTDFDPFWEFVAGPIMPPPSAQLCPCFHAVAGRLGSRGRSALIGCLEAGDVELDHPQ